MSKAKRLTQEMPVWELGRPSTIDVDAHDDNVRISRSNTAENTTDKKTSGDKIERKNGDPDAESGRNVQSET